MSKLKISQKINPWDQSMLKVKKIKNKHYLVETHIDNFGGMVYVESLGKHVPIHKYYRNSVSIEVPLMTIDKPYIIVGIISGLTEDQFEYLSNQYQVDNYKFVSKHLICNYFRWMIGEPIIYNNPFNYFPFKML